MTPVAEGGATPFVTVEVHRGPQGLEVTVVEPENRLTFPVGAADWVTAEPRDAHGEPVPVAASGGWTDEDTLRVELIFLESPHRLDITCTLSGDAEVAWRIDPLGDMGLATLHRPR